MKKFILLALVLTIFGNAYAEDSSVSKCGATLDGEERTSKSVDADGKVVLETSSSTATQE